MSILEQAVERVAAGNASTIESAIWSITYTEGYAHGRSDAHNGSGRDLQGATEGYAAGYARSYKWGITHPLMTT